MPEHWVGDDLAVVLWSWRDVIARDGYDFDVRWNDEKASRLQKKIMDLFEEEHADDERYSFD